MHDTVVRSANASHGEQPAVWDECFAAHALQDCPLCTLSAPDECFAALPAVLKIKLYVKRDERRRLTCTRGNVLLRDAYQCQYCGAQESGNARCALGIVRPFAVSHVASLLPAVSRLTM